MTKALSWVSALLMVVSASSALLAGPTQYRLELLPVPAGCESQSVFHGLDQSGTAVGLLICPGSSRPRAVAWVDSILTDLGTLGGPGAIPYGIGKSGLFVGTAETPEMYESGYHVTRPVVWENGEVHDLGTLGGPSGGATAMAPSGTIVGVCEPEAEDDYFEEHAFLFDGKMMHDLGTIGGLASYAYSLNDRGEVVGFSYPERDSVGGLPSWHAFVWRGGVMRDLGTLGGAFSEALDLNDRGDIVGWSFLPTPIENWPDRAVLWLGDEALDLNDLVPDRAGCVLTSATSINNTGDILANARCDYKRRVALLTPARSDR